MKRFLTMLVALCAATPAYADDALRARVADLLSGYEEPVGADALRALGDGVAAELLAIASNPTESTAHRERAVYALGWFPSEGTLAWLTERLSDPEAPSGQRRAAAWALVNGWGDAAVPVLAPALASPDTQLRAQCARALGRLGTDAARAVLRAQLATESNPMVRTTLQTALGGK